VSGRGESASKLVELVGLIQSMWARLLVRTSSWFVSRGRSGRSDRLRASSKTAICAVVSLQLLTLL